MKKSSSYEENVLKVFPEHLKQENNNSKFQKVKQILDENLYSLEEYLSTSSRLGARNYLWF